jgi:hypothetical protein
MEEKQMSYNEFLGKIRRVIQEKLGSDYEVRIQKITKNNGVVLDGLIIRKVDISVAPTIYLNSYYVHFTQGMSLMEIMKDILSLYEQNTDMPLGNIKELLDLDNIKEKVVYKLIQKESNKELLKDIPWFEFLLSSSFLFDTGSVQRGKYDCFNS